MGRGDDVRMAVMTALFNAGAGFAPVACIGGEWSGLKSDLAPGPGIPTCPSGHVLTQGRGLRLAWVPA